MWPTAASATTGATPPRVPTTNGGDPFDYQPVATEEKHKNADNPYGARAGEFLINVSPTA